MIDEINRANVDLAFGKFFTLLEPVHRRGEDLEIPGAEGGDGYRVEVPYSFRVLATMNSYDRALLFKLGYALTRRFAVVNHVYLQELPRRCEEYVEMASKEELLRKLAEYSQNREGAAAIDFERVWKELRECRRDNEGRPYDCIAPLDFVVETEGLSMDKWRDRVYSIEVAGRKIMLDNVLVNLVEDINRELRGFRECEVCPVQVTPGVLADALRYVALGVYAYKEGVGKLPCGVERGSDNHLLVYVLLLLDTAFSTYIVPQLDILADYANREKLYRGAPRTQGSSEERSVIDVLSRIRKKLEEHGLIYSAELVKKIEKGYHVF